MTATSSRACDRFPSATRTTIAISHRASAHASSDHEFPKHAGKRTTPNVHPVGVVHPDETGAQRTRRRDPWQVCDLVTTMQLNLVE